MSRLDPMDPDYWQKTANLWALIAAQLAEALRAEEDVASEALTPKAQAALAAYEEALDIDGSEKD